MNKPCRPKLYFSVLFATTVFVALTGARASAETQTPSQVPAAATGEADITALSPDLLAGIEKALPRVNQCIAAAPTALIPLGFIQFNGKAGDDPGWFECPTVMSGTAAEPNLENRVLGDILAQVQNALGMGEAKGVLIFTGRDNSIQLYVRNETGAEQYFVAQRPAGGKSDLKPADFKVDRGAHRPLAIMQAGVAS